MWNAGLDEAQARVKFDRRNINNITYSDDTNQIPKSEELKSLLMNMKEESEKSSSKLSIPKMKSWHLVPSLHGK